MSRLLQIILPLICEQLCGTRGLSRPTAAADTITSSGSPFTLAAEPFWQIILLLFLCHMFCILLLLSGIDRTRSGSFWDEKLHHWWWPVNCDQMWSVLIKETLTWVWLYSPSILLRLLNVWFRFDSTALFLNESSLDLSIRELGSVSTRLENNLNLLRSTRLLKTIIKLLCQPSVLTHIG